MVLRTNAQFKIIVFILIVFSLSVIPAQDFDEPLSPQSDKFDIGKMWTFDYPPVEYLKDRYGIEFSEDWFEDVRLSALRIPGCTASFISPNGLIMTNNHCSVWHRRTVEKEGEDLAKTGFYAETLEDERRAPFMYVEQLVLIEDVTDSVEAAFNAGSTEEEKIEFRNKKIEELVDGFSEETGLKCQIVKFYNGGKWAIYGYKRYNDVRLVFEPEQRIAAFGGDFDNFTYPRYDLDFTFFRVYDDDGKPLNTENYFKWSKDGAKEGEPIFTVGNPGRTNRLKTVAQLEYFRDVSYRNRAFLLDTYYNKLEELKAEYPERAEEFEKIRTRIGNAQKVFHYAYKGLKDPRIMARKKDFEEKLKQAVFADSNLKKNYGHIWEAIEKTRNELRRYDTKIAAYRGSRFIRDDYFALAKKVVAFAEKMLMPDSIKPDIYKGAKLDSVIANFYPEKIDTVLSKVKLGIYLDFIRMNLGDDNPLVQKLMENKTGEEAAEYMLGKSVLVSKEKTEELLRKEPKEILSSEDPFIYFVANTKDELKELLKLSKEVNDTEDAFENLLGRVIFEIYGTSIPPDATFTLRISDGVVKTFPYNGTRAIVKTTFYGMYDRYYGNEKEYPWDLPERWQSPPEDLDLATPYNFIATNDIVGGNSGSPVINKDKEIVGVAFDGNVQSIVGDFIYIPANNRMIAVASQAMIEVLDKVYGAERIVRELKTGELDD